jgi:hypothetical protein
MQKSIKFKRFTIQINNLIQNLPTNVQKLQTNPKPRLKTLLILPKALKTL